MQLQRYIEIPNFEDRLFVPAEYRAALCRAGMAGVVASSSHLPRSCVDVRTHHRPSRSSGCRVPRRRRARARQVARSIHCGRTHGPAAGDRGGVLPDSVGARERRGIPKPRAVFGAAGITGTRLHLRGRRFSRHNRTQHSSRSVWHSSNDRSPECWTTCSRQRRLAPGSSFWKP